MFRTRNSLVSLTTLLALAASSYSQTRAKPAATSMTPLERRASLNLEAARSNPLQLRNLLFRMPKGADLHNHLSGAVYAESWIRAAADDHLCLDPSALQGTKSVFSKPESQESQACSNGKIPTADVYKDQVLYDDLIDSFSMRGFVPSPGVTGHDQFFRTFARFGGTSHHHLGEWLDTRNISGYFDCGGGPRRSGRNPLRTRTLWPTRREGWLQSAITLSLPGVARFS